jgi:hypothetical protein
MDQLELCHQCSAAAEAYHAATQTAFAAACEADGLADQLGILEEDSLPKIPPERVPEYRRLYQEQCEECDRLSLEASAALRTFMVLRLQVLPV